MMINVNKLRITFSKSRGGFRKMIMRDDRKQMMDLMRANGMSPFMEKSVIPIDRG